MASTHAAAPTAATAPTTPLVRPAPGRRAADRWLDDLDAQVRARVRADGIDPQRDPAAVRRVAEQVVRAHDELSLTGVVAPVPDVAAAVSDLLARVSGFGPLQPFLDDPSVEEIWINDTVKAKTAGQRPS